MDDDTVVWVGDLSEKPRKVEQAQRVQQPGIVVWRLGHPAEMIKDARWHDQNAPRIICVGAGQIVYNVEYHNNPDGNSTFLLVQGSPGNMNDKELDGYQMVHSPFYGANSFMGRTCSGNYYEKLGKDIIVYDKREPHFLDFGVAYSPPIGRSPMATVRIFSVLDLRLEYGIDVPKLEVSPWCTRYSETSKLFYLTNCGVAGMVSNSNNVSQDCLPYWTLDVASITLLRHCIVPGELKRPYLIRVMPTDRSLMFWTNEGSGSVTTDPELAGLYEVRADKNIKLLSGIIDQAVISPNGCRIAMSYSRNLRDRQIGPGNYSVVAIDICKREN